MFYIFTFGQGQRFEGYAVKIKGNNAEESRQKMIDLYGTKWSQQYSEAEWAEMENDPNRCWPMEKVIKVIE